MELTLRERIEQEELAKFEEERLRAEVRARLASQAQVAEGAPTPPAPPAPIIVNVTNTNSSVATSTAVVGPARDQSPSMVLRLLYFCFIGWWFGPLWLFAALLMCGSVLGLPIGVLMFSKSIKAFFL
ncbi:YccF domain-containing protein [Deinococcus navajonensis]|uniref:Uncharacterized protein n=1 Tax=Deinococcus navajonensis TaxID=309884 RepID=A0ABV8XTX1_9DEIO